MPVFDRGVLANYYVDTYYGKKLGMPPTTGTSSNIVVTLDEIRNAMRLMAEKIRVIAEPAGALSLAAALTGKAGKGPIVAIVSGGNVDLKKFTELIEV